MSASIHFHGPYEYLSNHYPAGTVEYHPNAYGSLGIEDGGGAAVPGGRAGVGVHRPNAYGSLGIEDGGGCDVTLYFDSAAALDTLIEAATALRGRWPGRDGGAGVRLDGHQAVTVTAALDDAVAGIRDRAAHCGECAASPADLCDGCADRLARVDLYAALAEALGGAR